MVRSIILCTELTRLGPGFMRLVVLRLAFIIAFIVLGFCGRGASSDCFMTAVVSAAECFEAISCDDPSSITADVGACRSQFNNNIVKSQCTPAVSFV